MADTIDGKGKAAVSLVRVQGYQALPEAVGSRIGRSLQNILAASAFALCTRLSGPELKPPAEIVYVKDEERRGGGERRESRGNKLDAVGAKIDGQYGQLNINRAVVEFSIEQINGNDRIKIGFVDGSQLRVALEAGAIEACYIERETGERINIDAAYIKDALEGFEVTAVSSGSGGGNSPNSRNLPSVNPYDELVFERSDGAKVVLLLKPGAIKSIEFRDV